LNNSRLILNKREFRLEYALLTNILMENLTNMKTLVTVAFAGIIISSCSSTNLMSLSVMRPAPVTIPSYIKSVGVLNRSRASNESRTIDAIHKAVSLESTELQSAGSNASIAGLSDELMKNNRFTIVKRLTGSDVRSFGAGVFPSSMEWDSVQKICRESNTDAIFSLELYDAQLKVNPIMAPASLNLGLNSLQALGQQLNAETLVKIGWRIYDPSSRTILDEYIMSKDIPSSGSGTNPVVAASALVGRQEAIKDASRQGGEDYALRILPYWIRVSRDYFVRGNSNFGLATRMARAGNWDGAAALWKNETNNPNDKLAGRACYNMAIISEINGDLDGAIQWSQQAYEIHKIRLALTYLNILKCRKTNEAVLLSQNTASVSH
jgi:Family of unknown function (DUF6340)